MTRRRLVGGLLALACALLLGEGSHVRAGPSALTVNNTASAGPMTLRHAIDSANSNPGPDVINFDPAVFPPGNPTIIAVDIELSEVDDTEGITIDGTGAGVIIDGSNAGDSDALVFDSPTDDSGPIVVKHLKIQNFGGDALLVFNDGDVESVTLDHVVALDNGGAGVDFLVDGSIGPVSITDGEFSRNGDEGAYLGPDGSMTETTLSNVVANDNGTFGLRFYPSLAGSNLTVTDSTFNGNGDEGLDLNGSPLADIVVSNVTANGNAGDGLAAYSDMGIDGLAITDFTAMENSTAIDVTSSGAATGVAITDSQAVNNDRRGIVANSIGTGANLIARNTVTGNGLDGIYIESGEGWTISQNSTHDNGELGIDLLNIGDADPGVTPNDPGDGDDGPNTLVNTPAWEVPFGEYIAPGNACPNCLIEVFKSDHDPSGSGEGETFLADLIADSQGHFEFHVCGVSVNDYLTATATDADGNTSEFSANYLVFDDAPPCLPVNGDLDCDGDVDERDALIAFIHEAGATQLSREQDCPALGSDLAQPASEPVGPTKFGDVDCDGLVTTEDGLAILLYVSDLALAQAQSTVCARVGEPYPA